MAAYEIEHIRTLSLGVPRRGMWKGTRSFLCSQAEAPTFAFALIDTLFPNLWGTRFPQCVRTTTKWHPFGVPGTALVLAHYQTRLKPGQINVYYRTRPEGDKQLDVDLKGKIILGPAERATSAQIPSSWHIVEGSNRIPKIAEDIIVETVTFRGQFDSGEVEAYVKTINKNSLRIRDSVFPSGTLRLSAFYADDIFDSNYIEVRYFFTFMPGGWNGELRVQRGEWEVQQIETKDTSGVLTGEVRDVLIYNPTAGPIESRTLYEEVSWSRIPDKLLW